MTVAQHSESLLTVYSKWQRIEYLSNCQILDTVLNIAVSLLLRSYVASNEVIELQKYASGKLKRFKIS